jgi:hypothetical protein
MLTLVNFLAAIFALCAAIALARSLHRDSKRAARSLPAPPFHVPPALTVVTKPQRYALLTVSPFGDLSHGAQFAVIVLSGHPMIPRYEIESVHATELAAMIRFNELVSAEGEKSE